MTSQCISNVSLLVSEWHQGSCEELKNVILWEEECHERSEELKASSTFCLSGHKPAEVTLTLEWGHAAGPDKFTYLLAWLVPSSKALKTRRWTCLKVVRAKINNCISHVLLLLWCWWGTKALNQCDPQACH